LIDDIHFVGVAPPPPPTAAPTTAANVPTTPAANVTSLFSDAYTAGVIVGDYSPQWDQANVSDFVVESNNIKKYTMIIANQDPNPFAGIDFANDGVDASTSNITHLKLDVWTADIDTLEVRLVDFAGDGWSNGGNDSEGVKVIDLSGSQGSWTTLNIPLTDFVGLNAQTDLVQIILKPTTYDTTSTLYVDNLYFYGPGIVD